MFCPDLESLPVGAWCRVVVVSLGSKSVLSKYGVREGHVFPNCYVPIPSLRDSSKRIIVWLHGGVIDLYAGSEDGDEFLNFVAHLYGNCSSCPQLANGDSALV